MNLIKKKVKVVVIGGGIIGLSSAFHLAKLGQEVILLEKSKLTSGSTFHAAGLVGQLRTSTNLTTLLGRSIKLYDELEKEYSFGWKKNGGIRIATTHERMKEFKRLKSIARGTKVEFISPKEIQEFWPILNMENVLGGLFLENDGQVNPSDLSFALEKECIKNGVQIYENTRVDRIIVEKSRVKGVETDKYSIECDYLVNCAGQWAREVGEMVGITIPLISIPHQYIITEKIPSMKTNAPTLRDPDSLLYFKEEVGGLVMGGYEKNPKLTYWKNYNPPKDFVFQLFDSDWEQFDTLINNGIHRVPLLHEIGIKQLLCGPESFTPDGNFLLGPDSRIKNFFTSAGYNSFGIASSGGAGYEIAHWITYGRPSMDLWVVDPNRFGNQRDIDWISNRSLESYARHYTIHNPLDEFQSSRNLKHSPLYSIFKKKEATFGSKLGWERPLSFGSVRGECINIRNSVGIIELTSMGKIMIIGKDSSKLISKLFSRKNEISIGSTVYTMLMKDELIIDDLTVSRLSEDEYYIVTSTSTLKKDFDYFQNMITEDMCVYVIDFTSKFNILSVQGPNSKNVVERLNRKIIELESSKNGKYLIHGCEIYVFRLSFIGELGYELHIPNEYSIQVYNSIMKEGELYNIIDFGYHSLESLRVEKGIKVWGVDITSDMKKEDLKKFRYLEIENLKQMNHPEGKEIIYQNQEIIGYVSSIQFGYNKNKYVGIVYTEKEVEENERYEIEINGIRYPCVLKKINKEI